MTETYPTVPKDIRTLWYESNSRHSIIRTRLEANNRWLEAATCYKILGDREQYNACMMIYRSSEWGDNYRASAKPVMNEIENLQNEIAESISNPQQLIMLATQLKDAQERLSDIYKRYYQGSMTADFLFNFLKEEW